MRASALLEHFHPYLEAVIDFVYPPYCILCEAHLNGTAKVICDECWHALPLYDNSQDVFKALRIAAQDCGLQNILSAWEYCDAVETIIHEMKYFRKKCLSAKIGTEMARVMQQNQGYGRVDLLIPVPLHRTRLRDRGFNQSLLLAREISLALGMPVLTDVLVRKRNTRPQSNLGPGERRKNVDGAFEVTKAVSLVGKVVVLVDDVLTTGATLAACARTLHRSKARRILGITAAKTVL